MPGDGGVPGLFPGGVALLPGRDWDQDTENGPPFPVAQAGVAAEMSSNGGSAAATSFSPRMEAPDCYP